MPANGVEGDTVVVSGVEFGDSSGAGGVLFGDRPSTVVAWSESLVAVIVPAGAASGTVNVCANGLTGTGIHFDLIPPLPAPILTSIIPGRTVAGDTVWIRGEKFSAQHYSRMVGFTAAGDGTPCVPANVITWTESLLVALVPNSAATGSVTLFLPNGRTTGNSLPFDRAEREVTWDEAGPLFARSCRASGCHGAPPFPNGWSAAGYDDVLRSSSVNGR